MQILKANGRKMVIASVVIVALLMLLVPLVPSQGSTNASKVVYSPQAPAKAYYVNFTESGYSSYTANVANGWSWQVSGGVGFNSTSGKTNSFQLSNGTYSFSVSYSNSQYSFATSPSSGTVYVNGNTKGIDVTITFSNTTAPTVKTYDANFTVTNLPSILPGISWGYTVSITGTDVSYSNSRSTSSTTLSLTGLPIGNYEYTLSYPFGTSLSPASGSLYVSHNITVDLGFTLLKDYKVNFDSTGLLSTQSFSVTLSTGSRYVINTLESNSSLPSFSYVGFSIPNGTYYYTVSASSNGLSPSPSYGTVTVNGTSIVVNIQFATPTKSYPVTFELVNIPNNLQDYKLYFYVSVDGGYYFLQTFGTSVTFSLTNGTYSYYASFCSGALPPKISSGISPSSGEFAVQGKGTVISITFLPPEQIYTVKFVESGLSTGQFFSANIINIGSNATMISSTSNYVTFTVPNGSYSYNTGSVYRMVASNLSGTVNVNGASITVPVYYYPAYYLNFTLSNLPANIPNGNFCWQLKLVNETNGKIVGTPRSQGYRISFSAVQDGDYSYSIAASGAYTIGKSAGTVVVNDANVNVNLNVSTVKEYTITFLESGLLPGTIWGVVVDDGFVYSSNSIAGFGSFGSTEAPLTYTLTLPNGTYSIQGFVYNGNYASFSSPQSISVNGKVSNDSVSFTNSAPSTSSGTSAAVDTVLGVTAGLAVGIAAVTAFTYFRKRPPTVKPKSE